MKYSAVHNKIIIDQKDLDQVIVKLKFAMKKARDIAGQSRGKRNADVPVQDLDDLEEAIFQAAEAVGIDFGTDWPAQLDLS